MYEESPLGHSTVYIETYSPHLLFPIPRSLARDKIGIGSQLPFEGVDIWNGYEISWLNSKGKPEIALAEFLIPCSSPNIVESKSFKLYLNSFNQSKFDSFEEVRKVLEKDLSKAVKSPVDVILFPMAKLKTRTLEEFPGYCLDNLDIETNSYKVNAGLLKTHNTIVEEELYTNLLKSNCLATGQPDWGSVLIRYKGPQIDHKGLLQYIISFRQHSGFAEHCVEQIFYDIIKHCKPDNLTVYCRYTRRGGLDINPFRSNFEKVNFNSRQARQ